MLLSAAKIAFRIVPPRESAEDEIREGESTEQYVARLAMQKAEDVSDQVAADELILACDTVAECDGKILGKPEDRRHAGEMLRWMRGREHRGISGVCLQRDSDGFKNVANDITTLVMDDVPDQQLDAYLDTGLWEGKAGAFGFQDGIDWVHIVQGSESNVVGLPMELLMRMLP